MAVIFVKKKLNNRDQEYITTYIVNNHKVDDDKLKNINKPLKLLTENTLIIDF